MSGRSENQLLVQPGFGSWNALGFRADRPKPDWRTPDRNGAIRITLAALAARLEVRLQSCRTADVVAHSGDCLQTGGCCRQGSLEIQSVPLQPGVAAALWLIGDQTIFLDHTAPDTETAHLITILTASPGLPSALSNTYLAPICGEILSRITSNLLASDKITIPRFATPLAKWRLRRVMDYVEQNLGRPIRLRDLARTAGLSRMHFALQFRLALGVTPHRYVISQRIKHAQRLLEDPAQPIIQIALSVGFETQSYFSTVFKRYVGETPGRWRAKRIAILQPID